MNFYLDNKDELRKRFPNDPEVEKLIKGAEEAEKTYLKRIIWIYLHPRVLDILSIIFILGLAFLTYKMFSQDFF